MTIPLVWFLQWRLPEHFVQPVLHGQLMLEPDEARLAADRTLFQFWLEDVAAPSEERHRISLLSKSSSTTAAFLKPPPSATPFVPNTPNSNHNSPNGFPCDEGHDGISSNCRSSHRTSIF